MTPVISVVLHTVRPDHPYPDDPDRHVLGSTVQDLAAQTFDLPFELIIVDGLFPGRRLPWWTSEEWIRWVGPLDLYWIEHRKVAINSMKLTGLVYARGELVVSIDDVCRLPATYLHDHWEAWCKHGVCLAATWPSGGDSRLTPGQRGRRAAPGEVYGFHSYPLATALELNGHDLAYDGGRGLEDGDWAQRLGGAGVQFGLWDWEPEGFQICRPKAAPAAAALDPDEPVVMCCNRAWRLQRQRHDTMVANVPELWTPAAIRSLQGPCELLRAGDLCDFHGLPCPYLGRGFVRRCHPLAAGLKPEHLTFDLAAVRAEVHQ